MTGVVIATRTHITVPTSIIGLQANVMALDRESLYTPYGLLLPIDYNSLNVWRMATQGRAYKNLSSRHGLCNVLLLRHDGMLLEIKLIPDNNRYINGTSVIPLDFCEHVGVGYEVTRSVISGAMALADNCISGALKCLSTVVPLDPEWSEVLPIAELTAELKRRRCFKPLKIPTFIPRIK